VYKSDEGDRKELYDITRTGSVTSYGSILVPATDFKGPEGDRMNLMGGCSLALFLIWLSALRGQPCGG
jgi:hypothetical protein